MSRTIPTTNNVENTLADFCATALQMHSIAEKLGTPFRVFSDLDNIKLLKLPDSEFTAIANRLKVYRDVFQMASEQKELFNAVQEKQLLWFALRSLRLAPPCEFFNNLKNDYIVEVYMGTRQVYRTFNYYSLCSYSLDELETTPWDQLFKREDPTIVERILADVATALRERRTVYSNIPQHPVTEASSALLNEVMYKLECIVPLTDLDNDAQDCFAAVLSAQLISTPSEEVRRERQEAYELKRFAERQILMAKAVLKG